MYTPWFPSAAEDTGFISYIHQNLHQQTGREVPYPDSAWSYAREESPFEATERSDVSIHDIVVDTLYRNKELDSSHINVLVHNGVVNLSGYVLSEKDRVKAEAEIRKIDHIWNVENEILIRDELH